MAWNLKDLPPVNMVFFFRFGSFVFAVQALMSVIIFFVNLSLQTIFSVISVWLGVAFNLLISYLFLTMAASQAPSDVPVDEWQDEDVKKFLAEVKK